MATSKTSTSKSASNKTSEIKNVNDIANNFLTNLEELHKEANQMQADLQQACNEKIQAANDAYQKAYENEQKSFNDFMVKVQKSETDSEKALAEVNTKVTQMNEDFSKSVNEAQEKFRNAHAKINDDFSNKYQSSHKGLLKNYVKMYREYNADMMNAISKSVEANDPNEVIMACQSMITVSQDAIAKGIHLEQ
ncbi:MAG: hypothetical protein AB8B56_20195 [Crocinitomicaceae bacterium]